MIRRAIFSLILGVLLATSSWAFAPAPVYREPPKPKTPDVLALMQGVWELEQNVNFRQRGLVLTQQIRIQGTSWAYFFNNNGIATESTKYTIALDPKASPATLDLKHSNQILMRGFAPGGAMQMAEQIAMKGIVKVEGDTLTFCYVYGHQQNAERPKQFFAGNQVMPNGLTAMTMTLKRVR